MKHFHLWSHETRGAGPAALITPPALALTAVLLGLLAPRIGAREPVAARLLLGVAEMGVPLLTGLLAASLVGGDRAAELRLSLPSPYRATVLRRVAVTVGWAGLCALPVLALLSARDWWRLLPVSPGVLAGQLVWLSPTLWLTALGLLAWTLSRSTVAAAATVALVWLAGLTLFGVSGGGTVPGPLDLFATTRGVAEESWLPNRLLLLVSAVPLAVAAWLLLGNDERVLGGGER
ncbi:hypothetical protein [Streptosporangium saharense]|uniref:Uncharacterized protein n=1 Tax=Streptosporangium saharense TaxID=1706840 RepID=A0A7W7VNQ1_9ACTN|nr:hypothetical protein [Streptosporangium saharense]MBB4916485.1 hypothetical protein [Streptosporangium saharense]